MKLGERLQQSKDEAEQANGAESPRASDAAAGVPAAVDPLTRLKQRAQEALLVRMGPSLFDSKTTPSQLDAIATQELGIILNEEKIPLTTAERDQLVAAITDQVLGYGPIERYLADPAVSEIMVNGLEGIYVERNGKITLTDSYFLSDQHILRVIDRIVAPVGRRIDELSPMVDARLPDGSRVNAIIPPLAVDGPVLTIRKFGAHTFTVDDLVAIGAMTDQAAHFLGACVEGRANILVSGGTGSGKTTLLNVLSAMIPDNERIVTIEDSAELRLSQRHVVRLEGRPPNIEGRGEIVTRDLLRNALRMRPDRIIIGEVRGGEALDMLQAMNTGHDGSLSTLHANTPRDALSRLETLALMAGYRPADAGHPRAVGVGDRSARAHRTVERRDAPHHQGLRRRRDGGRDHHPLRPLRLRVRGGAREDGRIKGRLQPTGIRPRFDDRLTELGIVVSPETFEPVRIA